MAHWKGENNQKPKKKTNTLRYVHLGGKENENVLTYIKIELQMPKTQRTPSKVLQGFTVRAGAHMVPSPKSQAT